MIVSRAFTGPQSDLFYALMITSAANRGWPDDVSLMDDHGQFGLPRPSVIRVAKVASISAKDATLVGRLHGSKLRAVSEALQTAIGLTPPSPPR